MERKRPVKPSRLVARLALVGLVLAASCDAQPQGGGTAERDACGDGVCQAPATCSGCSADCTTCAQDGGVRRDRDGALGRDAGSAGLPITDARGEVCSGCPADCGPCTLDAAVLPDSGRAAERDASSDGHTIIDMGAHGNETDSRSVADARTTAIDECASPRADWLFCDGFEGGGTAPFWDGSDTNPVLVADPGAQSLAGNHVIQMRVPPGRGGAGIWKGVLDHQKLYARYYVKWENGYDMTTRHHGPGGLFADPAWNLGRSGIRPDGSDLISASLEAGTDSPHTLYSYTYYAGMYQDCADPNGSCWGDSFPCSYDPPGTTYYCTNPAHRPTVPQQGMQPARWYCIEQMLDAGTPTPSATNADGALDFWVDGVEIGPWPNLWMRSTSSLQVNGLWLYLFFHEDHGVEGLRFDDVVISTSRIGCR